jgi:Flp pilus assembly protein TadG
MREFRADCGSSAVEFALVFPLLLVLLFGVIDFGVLINTNVVIANATRDAARTASLGGSETEIRAQANAGLTSLFARDVAAVTVSVTCTKLSGSCLSYSQATSGDTAVVSIQVVHTWLFPLWPLHSITILKSNRMRIE